MGGLLKICYDEKGITPLNSILTKAIRKTNIRNKEKERRKKHNTGSATSAVELNFDKNKKKQQKNKQILETKKKREGRKQHTGATSAVWLGVERFEAGAVQRVRTHLAAVAGLRQSPYEICTI